jgi:hypothetical protein
MKSDGKSTATSVKVNSVNEQVHLVHAARVVTNGSEYKNTCKKTSLKCPCVEIHLFKSGGGTTNLKGRTWLKLGGEFHYAMISSLKHKIAFSP